MSVVVARSTKWGSVSAEYDHDVSPFTIADEVYELWKIGMDTATIAKMIKVHEGIVENALWIKRELKP